MSENYVSFDEKIEIRLDEKTTLPESLLEWLVSPDEWAMEREAMQMQNDLLQAERDELLDYVTNLKKLAIYLFVNSNKAATRITNLDFSEVEKNLPGYLRKEIVVDILAPMSVT